MQIACFGAANRDLKSKGNSQLVLGTSNPIKTSYSSGGVARNIAENLARLGTKTALLSRVGRDGAGEVLINELKLMEVDTTAISYSDCYPTATYTAVLHPDGELLIAMADMDIYKELIPSIVAPYLQKLKSASHWLIDANLPEATLYELSLEVPGHARLWAVPVSRFKARRLVPILSHLSGIIMNQAELHEITGYTEIEKGSEYLNKSGVETVVITLGSKGVYLSSNLYSKYFEPPIVDVIDVTGAGDAFTAGFLYGLANDRSPLEAVNYGLTTASMTIQSLSSVSQEINPRHFFKNIMRNYNLN